MNGFTLYVSLRNCMDTFKKQNKTTTKHHVLHHFCFACVSLCLCCCVQACLCVFIYMCTSALLFHALFIIISWTLCLRFCKTRWTGRSLMWCLRSFTVWFLWVSWRWTAPCCMYGHQQVCVSLSYTEIAAWPGNSNVFVKLRFWGCRTCSFISQHLDLWCFCCFQSYAFVMCGIACNCKQTLVNFANCPIRFLSELYLLRNLVEVGLGK